MKEIASHIAALDGVTIAKLIAATTLAAFCFWIIISIWSHNNQYTTNAIACRKAEGEYLSMEKYGLVCASVRIIDLKEKP